MTQPTGVVVMAAVVSITACTPSADRSEVVSSALALVALPTTDYLGGLAREPMIVQGSNTGLWVSGYDTEKPVLWRSVDDGETWQAVDVGSEADGAVGNSDVDLAVASDGTLYFVVMSYDRKKAEGTGIAVASSQDGGTRWTWRWLSRDRFDDRPWIEVAPDGIAHAIWNDGAGVNHALSTDRGLTWAEGPRVHASGGSSHFAIGPTGTLAVRLTPLSASGNKYDPGTDHLAVSTDGGASWDLRKVPGTRVWTPSFDPSQGVLRWVEPIAWDSSGALFMLWSEGTVLWLAQSADNGVTWTRWPIVEDSAAMYFPYLIARGKGELAATWFTGSADSLRANLAVIHIDDVADAPPQIAITRADPFFFPAFLQTNANTPPVRDTAGEYVPIVFLNDGRLAIVSAIQDPTKDRWGFTFRPYRIE